MAELLVQLRQAMRTRFMVAAALVVRALQAPTVVQAALPCITALAVVALAAAKQLRQHIPLDQLVGDLHFLAPPTLGLVVSAAGSIKGRFIVALAVVAAMHPRL
jgi:hypothetical protein